MLLKLLEIGDICIQMKILSSRMKIDVADQRLNTEDAVILNELAQNLACLALSVKNQATGQDVPANDRKNFEV